MALFKKIYSLLIIVVILACVLILLLLSFPNFKFNFFSNYFHKSTKSHSHSRYSQKLFSAILKNSKHDNILNSDSWSQQSLSEAIKTSRQEPEQEIFCAKDFEDEVEGNAFKTRIHSLLKDKIPSWFYQEGEGVGWIEEEANANSIYLWALYHANLLEGIENPNKDYDTAISLFENLYNLEPENSVALLYLVHLARLINDQELIQSSMKKLSQTKYFHSYTKDISQFIYSEMGSGIDFLEAFAWLSKSMVPSLYGDELIETYKKIDLNIIGKQMMEANIAYPGNWIDIDVNNLEYAVGYKILKNFHREKKFNPPLKQIQLSIQYSPMGNEETTMENLCSRKHWEDKYDQVRKLIETRAILEL